MYYDFVSNIFDIDEFVSVFIIVQLHNAFSRLSLDCQLMRADIINFEAEVGSAIVRWLLEALFRY